LDDCSMPPRLPIPPEVRRGVLVLAKGHCEDCAACASYGRGRYCRETWCRPCAGGGWIELTLHHLRYYRPVHPGRPDWGDESVFGREATDDLAALCWPCHKARHRDPNGEYWRDPEDMAEHWALFYEQIGGIEDAPDVILQAVYGRGWRGFTVLP
jgi:hypothetical protein